MHHRRGSVPELAGALLAYLRTRAANVTPLQIGFYLWFFIFFFSSPLLNGASPVLRKDLSNTLSFGFMDTLDSVNDPRSRQVKNNLVSTRCEDARRTFAWLRNVVK